ncbi:MAG: heat-inducible transcriptional repressor HrcA, partial [Rubrobacteraceae bacterium]|nr:heat-inducible transcription repressor HrcA [Rubrobacteraceae bacterium]MCL6439456.1 heat-inducible transcriptional repressor HrcA [Rubrobacteraceae bacterium]
EMRTPQISPRQHEILLKTLEMYISTGTPVSSAALSEVIDASSSTIRAELAELERVGLLTHPHTSAGRIPTDAGYRYYVDALMRERREEPSSLEIPEVYGNVDELLREVSEGMSEVTRLLAVVAGPAAFGDAIARVDYLPLGEGEVLLALSMESGAAASARVRLPACVGEDELREMLHSLNAWISGRPLGIDLELATAARKVLSEHNPQVVDAVLGAVEAVGRSAERGVFIQGMSALLARLDDLDPESLSAIMEIFERRRWLLRLMSDALERSAVSNTGVIVSIGAENVFYHLSGASLVAAAYNRRERPLGVVGLIGPKRMDYDAAISTVRDAAETLTQRLTSGF